MEDGLDSEIPLPAQQLSLKNGQVNSVMANCPTADADATEKSEVNGGSDVETKADTDSDSSAYDALVIDESVKTTKFNKPNGKRLKKNRALKNYKRSKINSTNINSSKPFAPKVNFNSDQNSELQGNELETEISTTNSANSEVKENCSISNVNSKRTTKKSGNPQLREYAQYLGLQPTVQFKCVRCKCAGFETLASLNEHSMQCTATEPVQETSSSKPAAAQFKIHRKVFLCSVCGTYYENWNLFLHMREVHRRYICLYCLGMFSQTEKLCLHLISKHNCVPDHLGTIEDFYMKYKEPCFLLCCVCEKVFNEQDDFINHDCSESSNSAIESVKTKVDEMNSKSSEVKDVSAKTEKQNKSRTLEHVTGDTDAADMDVTNCDLQNTDLVEQTDNINMSECNTDVSTVINSEDSNKSSQNQVVDENSLSNTASIEEDKAVIETKAEDRSTAQEENYENETEFAEEVKSDVEGSVADKELENHIDNDTSKEEENDDEFDPIEDKEENLYSENISDSLDHFNENTSDSHYNANTDEHEIQTEFDLNSEDTETRKVPKVTLKLTNFTPYNTDNENEDRLDSDASEGLVMEVENAESEPEATISEQPLEDKMDEVDKFSEQQTPSTQFAVAGPDTPIIELELEQPLDKFEIRALIQRCLRATVSICIYCNHARKIAVNGKQLGLHAIAEHRFSAIVNSITAEELIPESFNSRIKDSLEELENEFFNLESNSSREEAITFSHVFECFQCRYSTTVHKELYLHNRKMHAKTILLCIMCKSNFYSYSELICHLCPGLYALDNEVRFRCCMCASDELPSAFRLMVHLRKRHHACDVCLELCNNQSRLSNHVWKHKLHHFCYRCGIAYRNKPDITKHLFWKHGTESVSCKRCLQKKWPHVYHFCVPGNNFVCEECNLSFSRAVNLMVHKRLHSNETPHACTFPDCTEKFVSKKLLIKHEFKHREPCEEIKEKATADVKTNEDEDVEVDNDDVGETDPVNKSEPEIEKPVPKVDIYDLPELNLSESDSTDSETEAPPPKPAEPITNVLEEVAPILSTDLEENKDIVDINNDATENPQILDNIWDNFKNYQASKEKSDFFSMETDKIEILESSAIMSTEELVEIINQDHDYCIRQLEEIKEEKQEEKPEVDTNLDHDYCSAGQAEQIPMEGTKKEEEDVKPKKAEFSSDSSSDSDSSSCTCGSNCSCSSSSGSSSSSSDSSGSDSSTSEGRRKKLLRKEQRKQLKDKPKEVAEPAEKPVVEVQQPPPAPLEISIQESDLETTESDTDEDFYDEHPQKLAKQMLAEKRNKLLQVTSEVETMNGSFLEVSRPSTPSLPEELKPKKKSKSKKRKKEKKKRSTYTPEPQQSPNIPLKNSCEPPRISPISLSLFQRQSPVLNSIYNSPSENSVIPGLSLISQGQNHKQYNLSESESNLRASKRRRVPNKFYGYSSDEEREKGSSPPTTKWRKTDYPMQPAPLVVPPLTIKTIPPPIVPPTVEPISIRTASNPGEFKIHSIHPSFRSPNVGRPLVCNEHETGSDSNESSSEEEISPPPPPKDPQPQLYCYCRCPYDEVSEMIGCDSSDCAIEWFHFECVGIMVPPKGQWFCPDCRKKKQQQRRDTFQT